jgi:membrane fusion protein (multidrug efflux system)
VAARALLDGRHAHLEAERATVRVRAAIAASSLFLVVIAAGMALAWWKQRAYAASAAMVQPEPAETVTTAVAAEQPHQRHVTAIGTVLALRSVTLRNELAGTVRETNLVPGAVVEAGALLVALDVAVEGAELAAQQAEVAVAEQNLDRLQRALAERAASAMEVDRARANRDVARAQVARIEAVIARKTIRAPFRARVGLADLHPGQYLPEGSLLTTLQGVDDAVHVDFAVGQPVLEELQDGATVELAAGGGRTVPARITALDARIDPVTRNGMVRATVGGRAAGLRPGASVRVRVPYGSARSVVAVPVNALRKGPDGDHVFVLAADPAGNLRARRQAVRSGPVLGGAVAIHDGLAAGAIVAATGSFKLRDGALVAVAPEQVASNGAGHAAGDGR